MTASTIRRRAWLALVLGLAAFCVLLNLRDPMYPGLGLDPSWIMAAEFAAARGLCFIFLQERGDSLAAITFIGLFFFIRLPLEMSRARGTAHVPRRESEFH